MSNTATYVKNMQAYVIDWTKYSADDEHRFPTKTSPLFGVVTGAQGKHNLRLAMALIVHPSTLSLSSPFVASAIDYVAASTVTENLTSTSVIVVGITNEA